MRVLLTSLVCVLAVGCGLRQPVPAEVSIGQGLRIDEQVTRQPRLAASEERPAPRPVLPERRALLIGVDRAPGARPLTGAVGDVRALEEALLGFGFPRDRVVTLTDGQATRAAVLAAIDRIAAESPADGRVVVAFASHTRRLKGQNHLVTGDGKTVSARELADRLGGIRSPAWLAFPTCYAAGFSLPGIVGPGRVVTFASSAAEMSFEMTRWRRSFLVQYMVSKAMLSDGASSVEHAFASAEASLKRDYPNRVPLIDDRFHGDFVLGSPIAPKRLLPVPSVAPAPVPAAAAPPPRATTAPAASQQREDAEAPPRRSSRMRACAAGVGIGNCSGR